MNKECVRVLDWLNRKGKSVAIRLVKLTGKSPYRIHPKHLISFPGHDWYVPHLRRGDVLLDLGCGNGAHTLIAARHVQRVIGVDRDQQQLYIAGRLTVQAANVILLQADLVRPLPFPDGYCDAVLCLDLIEHIHARTGLLREIYRVLTPTGRLLISAPNRGTTWRRRLTRAGLFAFSDEDHKVEFTASEFLEEMYQGGFTTDALEPIVYDTPWAGLIDALGGISLTLYARLSRWKRAMAVRHPEESTGFRCVARKL